MTTRPQWGSLQLQKAPGHFPTELLLLAALWCSATGVILPLSAVPAQDCDVQCHRSPAEGTFVSSHVLRPVLHLLLPKANFKSSLLETYTVLDQQLYTLTWEKSREMLVGPKT